MKATSNGDRVDIALHIACRKSGCQQTFLATTRRPLAALIIKFNLLSLEQIATRKLAHHIANIRTCDDRDRPLLPIAIPVRPVSTPPLVPNNAHIKYDENGDLPIERYGHCPKPSTQQRPYRSPKHIIEGQIQGRSFPPPGSINTVYIHER